ncbi:Disrupted in renal carcinoma protein 2 [Portunus trituberculatus]|uniref:Disrupted in renal carcinoma protein 2 n=1 Tax=Portunus trituberculatus TaxID=210409 RepID=A0A5B7D5A6_PORTR|nr:Disrupted in renal carcinoma protein 2 [Portunus trituberculatus]
MHVNKVLTICLSRPRKLQMAMVLMVFAFSFGVPVVWIAVLNLSLKDIGINQDKAMGVAVTAVVCSSVTAFIAARITDKVYGHLKVTVITLLAISSVFFLWFLLLTTKVIYPTLGQVYVAVAGGLGFEYATVPLLVELAVEIGFPIPESVTGATLTFVFNIVSLVFLGLFQIPNEGAANTKACPRRNPETPVESRSRSSLSWTTHAPATATARLPSFNLPPNRPAMWPSVPKKTRKSLTLEAVSAHTLVHLTQRSDSDEAVHSGHIACYRGHLHTLLHVGAMPSAK